MEKNNRKSYNPLKMWGSWIGLSIGLLLRFIIPFSLFNPLYNVVIVLIYLDFISVVLLGFNICHTDCFGLLKISSPLSYFLYGWGIHSLIKKIKSK